MLGHAHALHTLLKELFLFKVLVTGSEHLKYFSYTALRFLCFTCLPVISLLLFLCN